jgi:hypothetical protein
MTPARRDAIKCKRTSELTPEQTADARECWLRDNPAHFPHRMQRHLTFLLDRLDERDARIAQLEDLVTPLIRWITEHEEVTS